MGSGDSCFGVNSCSLLALWAPLAMLWESVNSLVACLPMPFEAICTKFGELTLWSILAKSSANNLAGEGNPTVIVEIELMGVFVAEVG